MSPSIWAALAAVVLATLWLTRQRPAQPVIPSPRDTLLPHISSEQAANLPYPPDLLPGARDVVTPHGVMRVYEWGPETGDKVVLIHGDATPAPILGPIAHDLVKEGCRVMMFDLWGRGYSDTPLNVPHDSALFELQILFAAVSSPLSWTGGASGGFSMVAFSLGGGIAMKFAADFPYLINSMVLLAPGGLIRRLPDDYKTVFSCYPSLLPSFYARKLVGKALGLNAPPPCFQGSDRHQKCQATSERTQEAQKMGVEVLDIPSIVQWQFDHHKGFVHSFIGTLQCGPIQNQHSDWRRVCSIIKGDTARTPPSSNSSKLFGSKILVVLGDADSIVPADEFTADLLEILGDRNHVEFRVVAGGHGFPVSSCDEVAKHISDFWYLGSVH